MELLDEPLAALLEKHIPLSDFLHKLGLTKHVGNGTLGDLLNGLSPDDYDDLGMDREFLLSQLTVLMQKQQVDNDTWVRSITILGGKTKSGTAENVTVTLRSGSVTSIVGPTGSGKSRLLADIEWMAQNDTPTGRTILINDLKPDGSLRFSLDHKLLAQLSQNMNFVMDTSVAEFVALHAESRSISNSEAITIEIIRQANLLAGEPFTGETPVTALSGGQSRALMIADTAFLSLSPVVLIDEIENAGIDRKKALGLLVKNDKIVLIATHDPILALMAEKRLVIRNGGILKILQTSEAEKKNLEVLQQMDTKLLNLRNKLRNGEQIETDF